MPAWPVVGIQLLRRDDNVEMLPPSYIRALKLNRSILQQSSEVFASFVSTNWLSILHYRIAYGANNKYITILSNCIINHPE